jgi:hypothetical protein
MYILNDSSFVYSGPGPGHGHWFRFPRAPTQKMQTRGAACSAHHHRPYLDTLAGLELELVSNSSSSPKLTLALEVFG